MTSIISEQLAIYAQIFQNLAAGLAIVAAAWWFFVRRENVRKANVTHEVMFAKAGKWIYVGVRVTVKNTGRRRITSKTAQLKPDELLEDLGNVVIIEELSPYLGRHEVVSQRLSPEFELQFLGLRSMPGEIVIEPHEEQTILLDFVIPKTTETIKVYSHIDNAYNGSEGWNTATIHHVTLPKPTAPKRTTNRNKPGDQQ